MSEQEENEPGELANFTREQAWRIYGKRFLVGETYLNAFGEVLERKQFHGTVIRATPSEGIVVQLAGGEERILPPDFRPIRPADPGEYRLRATGEVVTDPDFTCSYTITRSQ